jgi:hypothetical protein
MFSSLKGYPTVPHRGLTISVFRGEIRRTAGAERYWQNTKMTDNANIPGRRRPGRPPKEEKRIPRSHRFTPAMDRGLAEMAKAQGRTFSGQLDFLVEHAAREMGWKLYDLAPAPIEDLHDRLVALELELGRLRGMIETGLDRNAAEWGRASNQLFRLHGELEAKLTANTTELMTAIGHLQKVSAHLLAVLQAVDAALRSREEVERRRPRPRVVPKAR